MMLFDDQPARVKRRLFGRLRTAVFLIHDGGRRVPVVTGEHSLFLAFSHCFH
ncbi:MAG: hypothetical protein JXN59_15485 [Anaerolineae bacterium]|nr:hypothetical protein [Anaerolineae bacterium]